MIHESIISSIPPDEMERSPSFMLPAMNIDDRAELLGGLRAVLLPKRSRPRWASLDRCCVPPTSSPSPERMEVAR